MPVSFLTEELVRRSATGNSFERGKVYYNQRAVTSLVLRGDTYEARVQGSEYEPYQVTIVNQPGGIFKAACSCPYNYGGPCKHIVAVCLTIIYRPDAVEEAPGLDELLAGLNAEQLVQVVKKLVEHDEELIERVEMMVEILKVTQSQPEAQTKQNLPRIEATFVRKRLKKAFEEAADYWDDYDDYYEEYSNPGLEEVDSFLELFTSVMNARQERGVLEAFKALLDVYIDYWADADDEYVDPSMLYSTGIEITSLLAEALLGAELTKQEREQWQKSIKKWEKQLSDGWSGPHVFLTMKQVLKEGWEEESLKRILAGEISDPEEAEGAEVVADFWGEEQDFDDEDEEDVEISDDDEVGDIVEVRLHVLARHEHWEEYLNLARAMKRYKEYVQQLLALGRQQEAIDFGLKHLQRQNEILELAQKVYANGAVAEALQIAEHGLLLPEPTQDYSNVKLSLAEWTLSVARQAGRQELALAAAWYVFLKRCTLVNYLSIKTNAGEGWPKLRLELLEHVQKQKDDEALLIFLHEDMIDEAIKLVEKPKYIGGENLRPIKAQKVLEAAADKRPEWVIGYCRPLVEDALERVHHAYYEDIVRYLGYMKRAYMAANKGGEWGEYIRRLRDKHRSKKKLIELMQKL